VPIKLYLVLCRRAVGFRNVAVFDVSSAFSQATNPYSWSASAMFEWSKKYNIGVQIVDDEHKHLFDVIAEISQDLMAGRKSSDELDAALDDLLDYAKHHFVHEEALMAEKRVDSRHVKRQQMEHKSFFYDISKLRKRSTDDQIEDRYERLIQFVTAWLVFHTLRTDQQLGIQLREISQGRDPAEAYHLALGSEMSALLYRPIVEALIHLWSDASNRAAHLEAVVEELSKGLKDRAPPVDG